MRPTRQKPWLVLLTAFSLAATACGGETTNPPVVGDGGMDSTTQTDTGVRDTGGGEVSPDDVAPQFTSMATTTATVGLAYNYQATASGEPAPTFSKVEGPAWLNVTSSGLAMGIPTEAGTFAVRLRATNRLAAADQTFSVVVAPGNLPDGGVPDTSVLDGGTDDGGVIETLDVTSPTAASGVVGQPFAFTATAEPSVGVTWSQTGLPAWAALDTATGQISGTPDAAAVSAVVLTATRGALTASETLTITVTAAAQPPTITSEAPTNLNIRVGTGFSYTATATSSSTVTWSLINGGACTPEIMIDPVAGSINWIPSATGTCAVQIRAANSVGNAANDLSFTLSAGDVPSIAPIADTTFNLSVGGSSQTLSLTASAVPAGTYSLANAPAGASIDAATGAISWTVAPGASAGSQTFSFEVVATNAFGASAVESFEVQVNTIELSPAAVTSSPITTIVTGQTYTYNATAAGNPLPISWSLVSPPSGMTVTPNSDGTTAVISWTAGAAGTYPINIQVDNPDTNGVTAASNQIFNLVVYAIPPQPVINTAGNPPAATSLQNQAYTYDADLTASTDVQLDGSAGAPINWTLESAPAGVTINSTTGVVSWTPDTLGSFSYTIRATRTDIEGLSGTALVNVQINPQPAAPVFTTTPPTTAALIAGVDAAPTYAPAASGVPAPTTINVSGLPSWMTFDGNAPAACPLESFTAGIVSGCSVIPASEIGGTFNVTFSTTTSSGTAMQTWSFSVAQPPASLSSVAPAAARNGASVPVTIRGTSFSTVPGAISAVSIKLGNGSLIALNSVNVVDSQTITAVVPADGSRVAGTYDVVVTQSGQNFTLDKRLNVTSGATSNVPTTVNFPFTLTKASSPWLVNGVVTVDGGGSLTIEPGATVMFRTAASRIDVGINSVGNLIANAGNGGEQIVFTWEQAATGTPTFSNYDGIRFGANTAGTAELRNIVLEMAGAAGRINGAIELQTNATINALSDSIIRDTLQNAIYLGTGSGNITASGWLNNTRFSRVGSTAGNYPINAASDTVTSLGSSLTFTDNARNAIYVRAGNINRGDASNNAFFRRYAGVDYITSGSLTVLNGITLNIAAGNTVRFAANSSLVVGGASAGGLNIDAAGTGVTLRSNDATSGQEWRGVYFAATAATSVLRGAVVTGFDGDNLGGVRLLDPTSTDDDGAPLVTIDGSTISSTVSGARGLYLDGNARLAGFTNNTITVNNAASVDARADDVHTALGATNTYTNFVQVRGGTIDPVHNAVGATIWARTKDAANAAIPLRLNGSVAIAATSLQIEGGNIIENALNAHIDTYGTYRPDPAVATTVNANGRIFVNGTATAGVTFKAAPGVTKWGRLGLRGNLGAAVSEVRYATIQDAGYINGTNPFGVDSNRASIIVWCDAGNCATPTVSNTTVNGSHNYGVYVLDGAHFAGNFTNNTITGSRYAALEIGANDAGFIGSGNTFTGNNTSATANHDGIRIRGQLVVRSQTWASLGAGNFYTVTATTGIRTISGSPAVTLLTIAAGAELRFVAGTQLNVGEVASGYSLGGNLVLAGTSTNRVVLTNVGDTTANYWNGVYYYPDSTSASTASYATIRHGGNAGVNLGNVQIQVTGGIGGKPVFDNVTLENSRYFAGSQSAPITVGGQPAFTNMTYQGNPSGNCFNRLGAGAACVAGPNYP